jgi:hypothetical protein
MVDNNPLEGSLGGRRVKGRPRERWEDEVPKDAAGMLLKSARRRDTGVRGERGWEAMARKRGRRAIGRRRRKRWRTMGRRRRRNRRW